MKDYLFRIRTDADRAFSARLWLSVHRREILVREALPGAAPAPLPLERWVVREQACRFAHCFAV